MKVVVIDDHPLILRALKSLFHLEDSIEVVGEAANRKDAIRLLAAEKPDIAIIDLRLGNDSGIDIIREAMNKGSDCKFVILTSSCTESDFNLAKEMDVSGYILKEALPEELINALYIVNRGRKYYDSSVLELVINHKNKLEEEDYYIEQLTPKELEVLMELGKGLSNKEISQKLFITEFTVKKHVSQIFAKLGLADRTQAALYANAKGLVQFELSAR